MDENKYYVQLSKEGYEACCKANASYGYAQGVKDSLRGMGNGMAMVGLALIGAIVIDYLVERHKARKQDEEVKKEFSE